MDEQKWVLLNKTLDDIKESQTDTKIIMAKGFDKMNGRVRKVESFLDKVKGGWYVIGLLFAGIITAIGFIIRGIGNG